MAYEKKTYVCFDADNDFHYYKLMTAWKENGKLAFNFHNANELYKNGDRKLEDSLKSRLCDRLQHTQILIVLIGNNPRNLCKYVRWEIEYALAKEIPIIGVNLNNRRKQDRLCPPVLRNELAIYIPFGQKTIDYALNDWPLSHARHQMEGKSGPFDYKDWVYDQL